MTPTNGEHFDAQWTRLATTPTAELSSIERSKQADAMFTQIGVLTQQNAALIAECKSMREQIRATNGRIDAVDSGVSTLAGAFYGRTLWQRLRWLVTGR